MQKDYDSIISGIFERHPSVQVSGFGPRSYKSGIGSMEAFDKKLGSPWKKFRSFHVAGTNGKGTVCSMIAACLAQSGAKVGLYTSPHLLDFRERIKVVEGKSFRMIPKEDVLDFLEGDAELSREMESLSFFEITTGMAFWWFDRQQVDYAVIEVGLGGRLDSTNIITPAVSVVTSIGLDHCAMLGNTRAGIASEKAGIFKPGIPAVVWGRDEETVGVFENCAHLAGCPLHFAEDYGPSPAEDAFTDSRLRSDCRTAAMALVLAGERPQTDALTDYASVTGLQARWERYSLGGFEVICDIGHNPAALEGNFGMLEKSGRPLVVVYGIMADKDLEGISGLMPKDSEYILCAPATPRALPVEELYDTLRRLRPDLVLSGAQSVGHALRTAVEHCKKITENDSAANPLIYVGGSTFVVAEALPELCATR